MENKILQDRYEIQKQLGKNPGRKTLLAKDLETQKLVVVKLLNFDVDFDWQDLKLFEREAQIIEELSHPAIPKYLDSFKVDSDSSKGFGLVQTYIPAKSLEEHIQSGRTFSEAEVKQIGKALLEVLNYLHTRQPAVIHRDIKPSNILLGNRSGNHVGEVYLVDFGSVKTTAQQQGGTMTVVGTYGYMSQEQFGGRSVPASDLYSLGATLIYLVTGSHPADLLGGDMVIEFEESVNLSSDFINWLKWMTQTTLKKRPNSAEVALKELENPTICESQILANESINTRIKLIKKKDNLEIVSPPSGLRLREIIISILFFLPSLLIIYIPYLLLGAAEELSELVLYLIIFGLPTVPIFMIWRNIIFSGCVYTCISVNPNYVQIKYQIFGLTFFKFRPISKSNIYRLVVDITISDNPKKQQKYLARLIISAMIGNYELKHFLSEQTAFGSLKIQPPDFTLPEIYWLAKELSDYFGLPVLRNITSIESDSF